MLFKCSVRSSINPFSTNGTQTTENSLAMIAGFIKISSFMSMFIKLDLLGFIFWVLKRANFLVNLFLKFESGLDAWMSLFNELTLALLTLGRDEHLSETLKNCSLFSLKSI
ncbi:hypothetical protein AYI68_g1315 [Smittium mucronatum]|uniref:Uncharacterized protein n=1 Tax=Smittium mucronatum TaxID=133383 RepID=A0A1R0H5X4_9FUNG|nr:hypothetical protein AYI68_g1315 [Smittium mucronatum]